ncbi:MAG: hypothetical protein ABEJ04_04395 [Halobacteriaceae archaeon]
MSASAAPGSDPDDVVTAVDEGPDGERLVIADVSRDEAWVSMTAEGAAPLDDWR